VSRRPEPLPRDEEAARPQIWPSVGEKEPHCRSGDPWPCSGLEGGGRTRRLHGTEPAAEPLSSADIAAAP
jgi:hypothetical protein